MTNNPSPVATEAPSVTSGHRHLLLVDDERDFRSVMRRFLSGQGYKVTVVPNAAEALAVLNVLLIDLVIIDLVMPEMDGLGLLKEIKKQHPKIPALMFTGMGFDEQIVAEAHKLGSAGFLSKNLPLSTLLAEVNRILNLS